jgi:anti-sigma regulatory factor (Ser/Thr protein kinase)
MNGGITLETPTQELAIDLPATPAAPRLARRAVERLELDRGQIPTVCLLASELVTNAVRHAANTKPTIRLEATIRDRRLCLCVTDSGDGFARPPAPRPRGEHGGYGLFLVEQLACRWGVADSTVWCELRAAATT